MREVARASARPAESIRVEVRDLASLSVGGVTRNLAYLASAWTLALSAIAVFWVRPSWWTFLLAFVVVSSRQQALLNVEHECLHGTFVRGRRWNERIGIAACASPCLSPFYASRARHLAHHRLLSTDADPDGPLHRGEDKSSRRGLVRHFALGLLGGYALMVLIGRGPSTVDARLRARDRRNLLIAQAVLFGGLWATFAWWVYPLLWLAPLGTLTAGMHLVRSFCEHAVTGREEAEFAGRLVSIKSNRLERFIVAPFFMNYHAEHHLFPWVPAPRLPELQRRIDALDARTSTTARLVRASYTGALVGYARELP